MALRCLPCPNQPDANKDDQTFPRFNLITNTPRLHPSIGEYLPPPLGGAQGRDSGNQFMQHGQRHELRTIGDCYYAFHPKDRSRVTDVGSMLK